MWDRSTGPVSSIDARKAQKVVDEFHGYLMQEHWEAVYGILDRRLQDAVGKTELKNAFAKINTFYGGETKFAPLAADPTEFLHRLSKLGFNDPKHSKGFEYYDAVVAEYLSTRSTGNLIYIIGVARADRSEDLKVSSLQIYRANDVENKNTNTPVLIASVAYAKVTP